MSDPKSEYRSSQTAEEAENSSLDLIETDGEVSHSIGLGFQLSNLAPGRRDQDDDMQPTTELLSQTDTDDRRNNLANENCQQYGATHIQTDHIDSGLCLNYISSETRPMQLGVQRRPSHNEKTCDSDGSLEIQAGLDSGAMDVTLGVEHMAIRDDLADHTQGDHTEALPQYENRVEKSDIIPPAAFTRDEDGDTQLHIIVIHMLWTQLMWVLERLPSPHFLDIQNNLYQTPLHLAVITGQPSMVRTLLCAGANPDIRDRNGNTALHIACREGQFQCVQELTRHITYGEARVFRYQVPLYRIPQDPNFRNIEDETCLQLAASRGHFNIAEYLVRSPEICANVNSRDNRSGRTILHHAVEARDMRQISFLLTMCPVDLEVRAYDGSTALRLAFGRQYTDVFSLLLQAGASPESIQDSRIDVATDSDTDSNLSDFIDDASISGQPFL